MRWRRRAWFFGNRIGSSLAPVVVEIKDTTSNDAQRRRKNLFENPSKTAIIPSAAQRLT